MKTILVTGGCGFIGSHLCERLLNEGYNVVSIDNFNDYYDPALKEKNNLSIEKTASKGHGFYKLYRADVRDENVLEKIFEENFIDGVVGLAANAGVRPSIDHPTYYVDVNMLGLTKLLEIMQKKECKSFVFASSSSVYGNNTSLPFKETDNVDNPISPYAATKKAGELLCYTYHHLYKMSIICLRYFTVYGPRQRPDLAINKFTGLLLKDAAITMFGDGTTARDYTFVSDIVEGTVLSLKYAIESREPIYDIFNLGGSNPITLKELISIISKTTHREAKIQLMPMQAGDVTITYSDYSHAKEILGYTPKISIEDGIAQFVKWYLYEFSEEV